MVLPSSSSRREATPGIHHAKAIGCLSGIFLLISKYQTRRKFLTFGKKHEKDNAASSPSNSNIKPQSATSMKTEVKKETNENSKFNYGVHEPECQVSRSPTLPADIQTSVPTTTPRASEAVTMAEKRVMLLGALQRCDEDLKSLRKIIESLKSVQTSSSPVDETDVVYKAEERIMLEKIDNDKCSSFNSEQQPSPVSVLDELARSTPVSSCLRRQSNDGETMHQQRRKKKPGEEETVKAVSVVFCNNNNKTPPVERYCINNKAEKAAASPAWGSKAMAESVERACKDIAWGEKREVGRIGLALQDHICRDLIQETVLEMGFHFPAASCRRRLRF